MDAAQGAPGIEGRWRDRSLAAGHTTGPVQTRVLPQPPAGPWLTSQFARVLLIAVPLVFLTGLMSYAAYQPALPGNDQTPDSGLLSFYIFDWPSAPAWLYRVNQGTHVTVGLIVVPLVLAKLWSVLPKLFEWPPFRSPSKLLERLTVFGLVGGIIFELATGIVNIQYWYPVPGGFYRAHLYGAWVFMACFVIHVALKLSTMRSALKDRRLRDELAVGVEDTEQEPPDVAGLVSPDPASPTMSRRVLIGTTAAGAGILGVMGAAQNIGGPARSFGVLAPRGRENGSGPNGFPVNKTADYRNITENMVDDSWRLTDLRTDRRRSTTVALRPARHGPAPRGATDRLCGGVVDRQSGIGRGCASPIWLRSWGPATRGSSALPRYNRVERSVHRAGTTGPSPRRCPARSRGQRHRTVARPWIPSSDHRPRIAGCAEHQVGQRHALRGRHMTGAPSSGRTTGSLRRWYGSGPAHLVAITLGGLVGVYAASKLLAGDPVGVIVWFVAGALLHDLVLVPAYTALDRVARSPSGASSTGEPSVPFWYDHIRVPVLLSGLLLLVFFPLILGIPKKFSSITGTSVDVLPREIPGDGGRPVRDVHPRPVRAPRGSSSSQGQPLRIAPSVILIPVV